MEFASPGQWDGVYKNEMNGKTEKTTTVDVSDSINNVSIFCNEYKDYEWRKK